MKIQITTITTLLLIATPVIESNGFLSETKSVTAPIVRVHVRKLVPMETTIIVAGAAAHCGGTCHFDTYNMCQGQPPLLQSPHGCGATVHRTKTVQAYQAGSTALVWVTVNDDQCPHGGDSYFEYVKQSRNDWDCKPINDTAKNCVLQSEPCYKWISGICAPVDEVVDGWFTDPDHKNALKQKTGCQKVTVDGNTSDSGTVKVPGDHSSSCS